MMPDDRLEMVTATISRIGASAVASNELIADAVFKFTPDPLTDTLVGQITAYVLECCHEEVAGEELVPADWWQAFKARWFPVWALERWPVSHRRIRTVVRKIRMCPHVKSDRHKQHIEFLANRRC